MEQPGPQSSRPSSGRPRHTTVTATLIIVGSALVVIGVVDQLGALHSLETRQSLEDFLRRPPGSDLGLDVDAARRVLRTVLMVVAGCATAALVLGFGVLRRDHRSRLALTVLAVPLFLGGLLSGGVWTTVIASASVFLWLGPSGDWFAGRSTAQAPREPREPREPEPPRHEPPAQETPVQTPPVQAPPVQASPSGPPAYQQTFPGWQQQHPSPYPSGPPVLPPQERRRPTTVLTACVLAWSLSGLVIALMSLTLAVVVTSPDTLWREAVRQQPQLADQGLSRGEVFAALEVLGVVVILWALVAIALASLVFRGSNGARIALAVSGYVAAAVCLLGTLSSPLLLLPLILCAAGASLLLRSESRWWCERDPHDPQGWSGRR